MRLSRVCLVLCALALSACQTTVTLIEGDKVVRGDQTVKAGETLRLAKGSLLTVKGDMTIEGTVDCSEGPARVIVEKSLRVKENIECMGRTDAEGNPGEGITMVVKEGLVVDDAATIKSDGHIQIVDDESKVLSAAALDALYAEIEQDTGKGGPRIGPLKAEEGEPSALLPGAPTSKNHWLLSALSQQASAQPAMDPCVDQNGNPVPDCVRIGGTWVVGHGQEPPDSVDVKTPEKGVKKIVLNFNFGPGKEVQFQNFSLKGPDGRDGKAGPASCNVLGEKGEDAFRFRVSAGKITINNFTLTLGSGGKGGDAITEKDCYPVGRAKAGKGGKAGNFKMEADEEFRIVGTFTINPGKGGAGGEAQAFAKDGVDGCPGMKGGDAIATGGDGGENKKELTIFGAVSGTENIELGEVVGGAGGKATASPGKGGNGTGCGCNGGPGGDGTATAGKGGDASVEAAGIAAASDARGGDGADADAKGGNGGEGGDCNPFGPGGNGGKGGDATGKEGKGGAATNPGADGKKTETGGDGGNGGDGCDEGGGGAGGKPNGKPGGPGKNLCPPPPKTQPVKDTSGGVGASSAPTGTTEDQRGMLPAGSSSSARSSPSSSSAKTSTGPRVISTTPANGATDVSTSARIVITFSEEMSRASVQGAIHASFAFEVEKFTGTTVTLIPQGLLPDKQYEFSVGTLAMSTAGKPLLESKTVRFRTAKPASGGSTGGGGTVTEPPPPASSTPATQPPPSSSSSSVQQEMVQVLIIQNKKVPVSQTVVEDHDECPNHYHAKNGAYVTALDGTQLPEPGGCTGYGRIENVPKQMCTPDGQTCQ